jgi:CBS domain-containing protein
MADAAVQGPARRTALRSGIRREEIVMANTARDIMSGGADCVGENETVADAARKMAQLGVGALPICGDDDRLKGMVTDRDIVIKVIAEGKDPNTCKAGELAQGKPVTIGADDSLQELVRTMSQHHVKRVPVIDGHRLVGVVSESDVASSAPQDLVVDLVKGVYASS